MTSCSTLIAVMRIRHEEVTELLFLFSSNLFSDL